MFSPPSPQEIREFVEREAEKQARYLADEILDSVEPCKIADYVESGNILDIEIYSGYTVADMVGETVDRMLTWTWDNIVVAWAYAGEYEPEMLSEVPKTIDEYATAVAYEVWYDKIVEKLTCILKGIVKEVCVRK